MYNFALVPGELSLLRGLNHYNSEKTRRKKKKSYAFQKPIKTIKGRDRLWYEHMKADVVESLSGAIQKVAMKKTKLQKPHTKHWRLFLAHYLWCVQAFILKADSSECKKLINVETY